MRVTEGSALDGLRAAMQVLVAAWSQDQPDSGVSGESDPAVKLQPLTARALALASRWTCVQWGCEAGWWSNDASDLTEQRRIGLSRLDDWTALLDHRAPTGMDERPDPDAGIADEVRDQLWQWVEVTCKRVREDGQNGFEALVSTFENALQIVPDMREGRVTLRFGKANTAHTRRKSGSYYTPRRIVELVLDQTLERALDEHPRVEGEFTQPLRVLDPACGAGLFLVSAAKRITSRKLAHMDDDERRAAYPAAFAKTVRENLSGVDVNPLALEWCRLWLWSCAGDRTLELASFAPGLRLGNALVGAPRDYWRGAPAEAWRSTLGDDKAEARRLKAKHQLEMSTTSLTEAPSSDSAQRLLADGWCAAFFWAKVSDARAGEGEDAPTYGALTSALVERPTESQLAANPTVIATVELARQHRFFHWPLEFPQVCDDGGFDVVVGNPPWIAHAGRAAQTLDPHLKHYFLCNYASFNGYPTTHGLFVERAATLLKVGGRLGFVLPASVSELGGYEAARLAHDRQCDFEADLTDFGEGCFPGVTQPCMGLVSRRREGGRSSGSWGAAWPMAREDLGELGSALLARLAGLPVLEPDLFGERGIQSDQRMKEHLSAGSEPHGRFVTPVREGADIREFFLGRPRLWADWPALGRGARPIDDYKLVRLVVRQTASFPIAALHDGLPFRNSLLAGFGSEQWEPSVLVALLNSSLVRWHHYMRHRDARQPVLPQVKVGHLRSIPRPVLATDSQKQALAKMTERAAQGETTGEERAALDDLVGQMYDLSREESVLVQAWAEPLLAKARRRPSPSLPVEG